MARATVMRPNFPCSKAALTFNMPGNVRSKWPTKMTLPFSSARRRKCWP